MKRASPILLCLMLALAGVNAPAQTARQSIIDSQHNLSPTGGNGPAVCTYCHAPHGNASAVKPLWNHQLSTAQYQFYSSSTYQQGAPSLPSNSPTRLCLSCHDGTVALGSTYSSATPLPTGRSLSATSITDLPSSHPFAFDTWVRDNTLRDELFNTPRVTGNASVKLSNGRIECTTCHEPHVPNIDSRRSTKFLAVSNANAGLCTACHDVTKPLPNILGGWVTSAHATSGTAEGATVAGYGSVAESACMSCHTSHGGGSERLLRGGEEKACFPCHANSSSSSRWARAWVGYDDPTRFMHPVAATGHRPGEDLNLASTPRHSECWDCHDAHAMQASNLSSPTAPLKQSSLAQAAGIDTNGNVVAASNQYEVCFKCHADSANKPQKAGYTQYGYTATRQLDAHNLRLDLNSQFMRHNVTQARSGQTSPAFRPAMLKLDGSTGRVLTSGFLYCTDCHNNNNAQSSGGTEANGPHISAFEHLLERRYDMNRAATATDGAVISLAVPGDGGDPLNGPFALCNKCHDIPKLLTVAGDTVFGKHSTHVVSGGISCAVCHAPHGVQGDDAVHHAHSLNLDLSIVTSDPGTGRLEIDTSSRTCYLTCHFSNSGVKVHSGKRY